jgi:hypothetical protein
LVWPGIIKYREGSKSILMIWFLVVIFRYFTILVLDHRYWVSDPIGCLKFSQCQNFDGIVGVFLNIDMEFVGLVKMLNLMFDELPVARREFVKLFL